MGQLTEQYIRVRAKPFIVEVDQQTNNIEQKMSVSFFNKKFHFFFLEKQIRLLKKGVLYKI
jgi:hypothetical protein